MWFEFYSSILNLNSNTPPPQIKEINKGHVKLNVDDLSQVISIGETMITLCFENKDDKFSLIFKCMNVDTQILNLLIWF
jgi:hypothetical protein